MVTIDKKDHGGSITKNPIKKKISPLLALVIFFLCFWGLLVCYTHTSLLKSLHLTNSLADIQPKRYSVIGAAAEDEWLREEEMLLEDSKKDGDYFGWSPKLQKEMECSWRKCFSNEAGVLSSVCKTCRDSKEDMGIPPPRPNNGTADDPWIPDVTILNRMMLRGKDNNGNEFPPPLDDELCEPMGVFGGRSDDNLPILKEIVIQDSKQNFEQTHRSNFPNVKIFCGVYTMETAHATSIRAIRETWGPLCDGFLAFSTADDPRIPAISLPHDGPEEYNNMWQKVRSIWRFVGKHYLEDYDFFFLGGDDLFVIPPNLRNFLQLYLNEKQLTSNDEMFLGRRFKGYGVDNYFNSGGAGYTLSRGTLRKIYTIGLDHGSCNPDRHTAMEDVMIAECLRNVFHIGITDTRDANGRERFHPFSPGTHFSWKPPGMLSTKKDWYEEYNKEWGVKLGFDCCAPDSVSFHYIKKPTTVRHMQKLLYNCTSSRYKSE